MRGGPRIRFHRIQQGPGVETRPAGFQTAHYRRIACQFHRQTAAALQRKPERVEPHQDTNHAHQRVDAHIRAPGMNKLVIENGLIPRPSAEPFRQGKTGCPQTRKEWRGARAGRAHRQCRGDTQILRT